MSMNNEIVKIPFYGNEIVVIEKNGNRLVAMKPIIKALGLDWSQQVKNIKNDPVLSSVMGLTPMTGEDDKQYQMLCLPLKYLNGWLFKVPASRYKGKKREAIIRYQKECYCVLYEYFHNGAAINPGINLEQVNVVLKKLLDKLDLKDEVIQRLEQECENRQGIIDAVTSESVFGEISQATGKRKFILVRQHFRSYAEPQPKKPKNCLQMVFDFFTGGK